jgi:hypothetical protein
MNLLNFIEQSPNEQVCIERFKVQRDQNGVDCLNVTPVGISISGTS